MSIPVGLFRCHVCGEFRGSTRAKYLNVWGVGRDPDRIVGVSCLCQGPVCRQCGIHRCRLPGTNEYDAENNRVLHIPGFWAMRPCDRCVAENRARSAPSVPANVNPEAPGGRAEETGRSPSKEPESSSRTEASAASPTWGCQACMAEDPEQAWALSLKHVETLVGKMRFSFSIQRCPQCGQKFAQVVSEYWSFSDEGSDAEYIDIVPVSDDEIERLRAIHDYPERLLERLAEDRRYLSGDHWGIRWREGGLAIRRF